MANLITKHDPYNIHKILGVASLLSYLLRVYYLFLHGTAFPQQEPQIQAVCCVLLHGALSTSSLLLPLPLYRNFSSPMIWPEFRLHSITFAMRHVIATIFAITNVLPNNPMFQCFIRIGLILLTIECASMVTQKFGDQEKRTTNSMPYPHWITSEMQKSVKNMYARAQFGATKLIVLGDPTLTYFPLLAIQTAPLLMTLVRKGKISCITYHRVYAISLTMSFVALFIRLWAHHDKLIIVSLIFSSLLPLSNLRKNGLARHMIWICYAMFHFTLVPMINEYFGISFVVLVCGLVIYFTGNNHSDGSINAKLLWVWVVLVLLTIKRFHFGTDHDFENAHIDPYILRIVPLMILYAVIQEILLYKCLFIC